MNGVLTPVEGGDDIPLLKEKILLGRASICDIQLEEKNISNKHCELRWLQGVWMVVDLKSANGTKVNGERVEKKKLFPGDKLTIARKHHFIINYTASGYGLKRDEEEEEDENVMKKSLLERAGLQRRKVELDSDLFPDD